MNAQLKKPAIHGRVGGAVSFDRARCESEALAALEAIGVNPGGTLEVSQNGSFTRCATVDHPRSKNGAYRWFVDGLPNLQGWNHETNQACEWIPGRDVLGRELTPAERGQIRQQQDEARKAHEQERESRRQKAIADTRELLKTASTPASDWPYLARKGIGHHAERLHLVKDDRGNECLLLPLRDTAGGIFGAQRIYAQKDPNGNDKKLLSGTDKKGHAAYTFASGLLEPDAKPECILITEGIATSASVYDLSDGLYPVVCAVDAGNLEPVAMRLRERFPASKIVVCGDVDGNQTGQRAAGAAAEAVGGVVCLPDFLDQQGGGTDWNDLFLLNEDEARRQLGDKINSYTPKFRFLSVDDILTRPRPRWKVKNLLPETGMAAIYGAPGTGKSFLALHLADALSTGSDWFGHRVTQSPVVYLCLEGQSGLRNRTEAFRQKYGDKALGAVCFIEDAHDLIQDHQSLIADIKHARLKNPVIIIDTLNRATPGRDENSGADMGLVIAATKALEQSLNALVVLVHHSGKDASRGLRGHSSLHGALDVVLQVDRSSAGRKWQCEKVKDGRDDLAYLFDLEEIVLGIDEDGDEIKSCAVSVPDDSLTTKGDKGRQATCRLTGKHNTQALEMLRGMYQRHRQNKPDGPVLVEERHWREAYCDSLGSMQTRSKTKTWGRVLDDLIVNLRLVRRDGVHVLLTESDKETK